MLGAEERKPCLGKEKARTAGEAVGIGFTGTSLKEDYL